MLHHLRGEDGRVLGTVEGILVRREFGNEVAIVRLGDSFALLNIAHANEGLQLGRQNDTQPACLKKK